MLPDYPRLEFLPIDRLILHEWHDNQRTPPLIARIREYGLFRNPPIVSPLGDESGRYMVLDGANRFTALKEMGFPHILVQLVEPGNPGMQLQNWNHVVWGISAGDLCTAIEAIPEISLEPTQEINDHLHLEDECTIAVLQLPDGNTFNICTPSEELVERVNHLNSIVNAYKDRASLDRTSVADVSLLTGIYADLSGLLVFPHFDVRDVLALAGEGYLLPTGITRFTVYPRALHVNYPLYELAADKPIAEKNADLQRWVQERIARKGVRYYAEPTFLYDE